jgi:hypothetical protein
MSLEYKTPEVALELAEGRLRNPALQQKVAAYLGGIWPQGFELPQSPVAVYAPYLAKASETEVAFLSQANAVGFATTVATYEGTEYVTANAMVIDCYRAPLIFPKGQRVRRWVVPEESRNGTVGDAATVYDELSIVNYWRGIRAAVLEENNLPTNDKVVDWSEWYGTQSPRFGWDGERSRAAYYYMAAMALYASGRAVLFDTPPTAFATKIMQPAYDAACNELGVEPIVTNELRPDKRDWTDLSFLDERQAERLQTSGRIPS